MGGLVHASDCTECSIGSSAGEGQTECSNCVPGRYATDEMGEFGVSSGATLCASCPDGTYNPYSGAILCSYCSAGTFASTSTKSLNCTACEVGKYSTLGAGSCDYCESGKYTAQESSHACEYCSMKWPGTTTTGQNTTSCSSCGA